MFEVWKDLEGQVVDGEFRLIHFIGGSAESGVFATQFSQTSLRSAAIKIVRTRTGAEKQLARWRHAANLSHRHLIRVFAVGECQLREVPVLYVVMEYAEENLGQIVPQRPLTPAEAQEMLRQVTDGMVYLHAHGLIHGRVQPANIMAVGDQIKLSSDSVCPSDDSDCRQQRPDAYSAPEGVMSPQADVWSLGVVLVEALTLRRPTWDAATHSEPMLAEGMTAPFLEISRRCLQIDPKARWTINDVVSRLERESQNERPIAARLTEAPPKRSHVGLVATVCAALVVGGIIYNFRPRSRESEPLSTPAPQQTEPRSEATQAPNPPAVDKAPSREQDSAPKTDQKPSPAAPASETTAANVASHVPGAVLHRVMPEPSRSARNTIQGHVRVAVRVTVDASGEVVNTMLESAGPSRYFAHLADEAARKWKFSPAQANGEKVPSEWILRFSFGRGGTDVTAAHAEP